MKQRYYRRVLGRSMQHGRFMRRLEEAIGRAVERHIRRMLDEAFERFNRKAAERSARLQESQR